MSLSAASPLLLHNPRCSKSRAAKAWLDERGQPYTERLYLEDPLNSEELAELGTLLGSPASEWVRASESAYESAQLSNDSTQEELIQALSTHPSLMQRPIVVNGTRAAIGRPLELVMELFESR
ncbi:MAG: arsenate reductase [Candidatus Paceibacteria bacterium]|jgi:arsenate reductase